MLYIFIKIYYNYLGVLFRNYLGQVCQYANLIVNSEDFIETQQSTPII